MCMRVCYSHAALLSPSCSDLCHDRANTHTQTHTLTHSRTSPQRTAIPNSLVGYGNFSSRSVCVQIRAPSQFCSVLCWSPQCRMYFTLRRDNSNNKKETPSTCHLCVRAERTQHGEIDDSIMMNEWMGTLRAGEGGWKNFNCVQRVHLVLDEHRPNLS